MDASFDSCATGVQSSDDFVIAVASCVQIERRASSLQLTCPIETTPQLTVAALVSRRSLLVFGYASAGRPSLELSMPMLLARLSFVRCLDGRTQKVCRQWIPTQISNG